MVNGQPRSKDWVVTVNNYTPDEETALQSMVENGHASYVIFGRERGEGGTPHLQGFIQLKARTRLASVKAIPGLGRAHLEPRRGSVQEAAEYCKKEGDFEEYGSAGGQGKRADLNAVKESIDEGADTATLWENHFGAMVRYEQSFKRYRALNRRRDPNVDVEILVLWGPTGTGKSRFPRLIDPELFSLPDITLTWFDGYDGQEVVLLDDFDGKDVSIGKFLRYFDRYDIQVPVKGGFTPFIPKRIWISSNTSPEDWFPNELQVKRDAVRRRLTRVCHLENPIRFEHQDDIDHIRILLNLN